jgi:hypothetical protein
VTFVVDRANIGAAGGRASASLLRYIAGGSLTLEHRSRTVETSFGTNEQQ